MTNPKPIPKNPGPHHAAIQNFNDAGPAPGLKAWVDGRFSMPSQYETVVFHGQSSDETLSSAATA